jgi:hypothetical protein
MRGGVGRAGEKLALTRFSCGVKALGTLCQIFANLLARTGEGIAILCIPYFPAKCIPTASPVVMSKTTEPEFLFKVVES